MNLRNVLLLAYDDFGGPVDNNEITDHVLGMIVWDGTRERLHLRLSSYKSQLTREGLLTKIQHPGPNGPGVHELTPAGQIAAPELSANNG